MIQFIYFDVGKVLLDFSHERMFAQMAQVSGVTPEVVRAALVESPGASDLFHRVETGQVDESTYYEEFCCRIERRPDRQALELAASDIFAPLAETWSLVRELSALGTRLGLLSNAGEPHWGFLTGGRFDLLAQAGTPPSPFEVAISSHLVGVKKPDPEIYQLAIDRAGVAAEKIFFTDDRPENVAAAQAVGIDARQFTSAEDTANYLKGQGIALR